MRHDPLRKNDDVTERQKREESSHGAYMGGSPAARNEGNNLAPPTLFEREKNHG
jgi:hypothetical protein